MLWLAPACLLSACATRGTLDIDCANLAQQQLPASQLVKDIQSGAKTLDTGRALRSVAHGLRPADAVQALTDRADPMFQQMVNAHARDFVAAPHASLLLSGGGQWGAYGAGFLADLDKRGKLPRFSTVTGVSTGALQSIFIGAMGDPEVQQSDAARRALFVAMVRAYRPARERDVVNRSRRKELAIVTGSFAGLAPLRRRILTALCDDAQRPTTCPLIAHIAKSRTGVFVGYVKAEDGGFYYSDISALARKAYPDGRTSPAALAEAQRCIAGAALASLAMPVFFQQVRIGPKGMKDGMKTYFDGGVRLSVFEAEVAGKLVRAAAAPESKSKEPDPLYIIRNGPTVMLGDPSELARTYNAKLNIVDAALRAEAILVNQLEVQSIADLRLANPRGRIFLRTADGFGVKHATPGDDPEIKGLPWSSTGAGQEVCVKNPPDAMFIPSFMACIMRLGRAHAQGTAKPDKPLPPWMELSTLPVESEMAEPRTDAVPPSRP
jgi:hypothetical protein